MIHAVDYRGMKQQVETSFATALLRIRTTYLWRHGRLPDLAEPTRFTELVQLRKLLDRDPRMPLMADKVRVKAVVAERLGREWVVPMLWSGVTLPIDFAPKMPFIIKSRHGCNQTLVVSDGQTDWPKARARMRKWVRRPYGRWLDEWLYQEIPRGCLIESFVGNGRKLPIDYKIFVFHGRAAYVQVHLDRDTDHRWMVYDLDWRPLSRSAPVVARPTALRAMVEAAEVMAADFSFARVDFYQPEERPLFGEITFYPGSGLDPFDPPQLDREMGSLWLNPSKSKSHAHASGPEPLVA